MNKIYYNINYMVKMGNLTKPTTTEIPPHVWSIIHEFLLRVNDKSLDFQKAYLRPSVANIYLFFVFIYVALIVTGVLSNVAVIAYIIKHKLYTDATYSFLINSAASDIFKCVFVIPISLYVLLIQNWVFGELLCYFLPMLQDIPFHVSTLTFLLIAWDRYRNVRNLRVPAGVCILGTWFAASYLVIPYLIYVTYVDLEKHLKSFSGVGVCIVNLTASIQNYVRGIFLFMYLIPLATMFYLHAKTLETARIEDRNQETVLQSNFHSSATSFRGSSASMSRDGSCVPNQLYIYILQKKISQKYLAAMVTIYAILLCPLMLLRLATVAVSETNENSGRLDITYITLVWFAFLPTCTTPLIFALWQRKRLAKIRRVLFGNRDLQQSFELVTISSSIPTHRNVCQRNLLTRCSQDEHSVGDSRRPDLVPAMPTNRVRNSLTTAHYVRKTCCTTTI